MQWYEVCLLLKFNVLLCLWSGSHCCQDGDVRLVDGFSANSGRVEFCHDGEWGTVCDDDWKNEDAEVVCRQLGLPTSAVSFLSSFGGGNGSILIDNAACSGVELRLEDCIHNGIGHHDCKSDHTEDAGVFCDENESNCTLVVSSPSSPPTLAEPLTRTCLQRYGNCIPYRAHEQGSVCDDFYMSEVDYVYVPNTRHRGRYSRLRTDIAAYGELLLAGLDNCNVARRVICHFYLPPCGNSTHFELPTSVCKDTCHQVEKMCEREWESVVAVFKQNRIALEREGMTFIECEDPGRHLNPIPYQCSDLNISTILPDKETHHYSHSRLLVILLCTVLPAALVSIVTVVTAVVIFMRKHKKRQAITQPTIHLERPVMEYTNEGRLQTPNSQRYAFDNTLQPITPAANLPRVPSAYIRNLTEQHLLIPRQNIHLIAVIGQGEFGVVYKANLDAWQGMSEYVEIVAVKTLKVYSDHEQSRLIEESLVMIKFDHMNVMKLSGVSPHNGDSLYIVMPFMIYGSLLSYLRKNRADLTILTDDDLDLVDDVSKKLWSMCLQIAKGMSYLASLKFLHRDLAARNCMIDENFVIKVADFGLSEDIYSRNYFRQDEDGEAPVKLPVRWMALESLSDGIFSEMTDVWSFGVTCWEVFSLGKMPYPGIEPRSLVKLLERGERLEKPLNAACSQEIFIVIDECWNEEPDKRPTFSDLVTIISNGLEGVAGYLDLVSLPLPTTEHPLNDDLEIISQ